MAHAHGNDRRLFRLLWLSIAAAVATITLKAGAWLLTGSVGLLSDAAESVVNLVAAVVAVLTDFSTR
jgi:divalent metal cation (Fe/Co/Zn/Cd) transporter